MTEQTFLLADRDEADKVIGERIHLLMWRKGYTHDQLAKLLGMSRACVSNRLRGKIRWLAVEVAIVSSWLDVDVKELIPTVLATGLVPVEDHPIPEGSVVICGKR